MAFFKDGFQKLVGAVKGDDSRGRSSGYCGQLSAERVRLSSGCWLGPGAIHPPTLASWYLGYCRILYPRGSKLIYSCNQSVAIYLTDVGMQFLVFRRS